MNGDGKFVYGLGCAVFLFFCAIFIGPLILGPMVNQSQDTTTFNNGPTIFSDDERYLQGQSQSVQDSIALTQNAVAVCTELNNCFAPKGYVSGGSLGILVLVVVVGGVLLLLFWPRKG